MEFGICIYNQRNLYIYKLQIQEIVDWLWSCNKYHNLERCNMAINMHWICECWGLCMHTMQVVSNSNFNNIWHHVLFKNMLIKSKDSTTSKTVFVKSFLTCHWQSKYVKVIEESQMETIHPSFLWSFGISLPVGNNETLATSMLASKISSL